jgi:hypothetical protein
VKTSVPAKKDMVNGSSNLKINNNEITNVGNDRVLFFIL